MKIEYNKAFSIVIMLMFFLSCEYNTILNPETEVPHQNNIDMNQDTQTLCVEIAQYDR